MNDADFAFALETVQAASVKILEIYQEDFQVDFKRGREPVTRADRAADEIIIGQIRRNFPQDSLLTEENGFLTPPTPFNGRVWFVDPIDGTREFINRNGEFAIQIAVAENRKLVEGYVYRPTTRDFYGARRGGGSFHRSPQGNWRRLTIPPRRPGNLIVAMSRSHPSKIAQKVSAQMGVTGVLERGSVGLKLMGIVNGEAHFYVNDSNSTKAWDIAAPQILFTEAGGVVTDIAGKPFDYDPGDPHHHKGLLASSDQQLHIELLGKLNLSDGWF
jgi:3'(2'), 5'-bisphosphate nucleotidase